MQIVLVGINHKTAPVEIRERLACDAPLATDGLNLLAQRSPGSEFVLLSTCNRIECYAAVSKTEGPGALELARWLAEFRAVEFAAVEKYFYIKMNEEAVTHLLTVTASLDSMVIGESQIAAQVKESYRIACKAGTSGKILNRLFHEAFRTNKEIVSTTSIASRRVSVAGVAVELAKQLFFDIKSARTVIVGAGQMGQLLVEHFLHEQCRDITVINRSLQRACLLAQENHVSNKPWESLDEELIKANIIVGAASAPEGYLFGPERTKNLMARRRNQLLLIIDLAVPRGFDPQIGNIENVYLYSIDDLAEVARDNIKLREGDLEKAVEVIYASVSSFMDWFETRDVGPVIGKIRDAFEKIRESEMEKFFVGPRQQAGCREAMEASMARVVNKLCHCVLKNIDILSRERGADEAEKFAQNILADAQQMIAEDKKNPS
jgi:glutamyl-tRNA reductase